MVLLKDSFLLRHSRNKWLRAVSLRGLRAKYHRAESNYFSLSLPSICDKLGPMCFFLYWKPYQWLRAVCHTARIQKIKTQRRVGIIVLYCILYQERTKMETVLLYPLPGQDKDGDSIIILFTWTWQRRRRFYRIFTWRGQRWRRSKCIFYLDRTKMETVFPMSPRTPIPLSRTPGIQNSKIGSYTWSGDRCCNKK